MKSAIIGVGALLALASPAFAQSVTGVIAPGNYTDSSNSTSVHLAGVQVGVEIGDHNGDRLAADLLNAYLNGKNITVSYTLVAPYSPCNVVYNPGTSCFHIQSVHFNN